MLQLKRSWSAVSEGNVHVQFNRYHLRLYYVQVSQVVYYNVMYYIYAKPDGKRGMPHLVGLECLHYHHRQMQL